MEKINNNISLNIDDALAILRQGTTALFNYLEHDAPLNMCDMLGQSLQPLGESIKNHLQDNQIDDGYVDQLEDIYELYHHCMVMFREKCTGHKK